VPPTGVPVRQQTTQASDPPGNWPVSGAETLGPPRWLAPWPAVVMRIPHTAPGAGIEGR